MSNLAVNKANPNLTLHGSHVSNRKMHKKRAPKQGVLPYFAQVNDK